MNSFFVFVNSILALSALFFVAHGATTDYPKGKLTGMVGYAAEGGVTGGSKGKVVTISNLADLQKHIADSTAKVLVLIADISASKLTKVNLGSNKSIIGSFGGFALNNIHFRATKNSGNIIFQNLKFQHSKSINANDDIQLYLNYGTKYWIDHCSFVGHEWSANDGSLDKLLYVGAKADYVTISNCYFGNHKYGLIIGYPQDGDSSYDGYPRMTICNNHFENLEVRAPGLMRYGRYHVYNNLINKYHLGYTVHYHCQILSENNVFQNGDTTHGQIDDKGTGAFSDTGSTPAITNQKSPKSSMKVKYSYKLLATSKVAATVKARAGVQTKALVFGS